MSELRSSHDDRHTMHCHIEMGVHMTPSMCASEEESLGTKAKGCVGCSTSLWGLRLVVLECHKDANEDVKNSYMCIYPIAQVVCSIWSPAMAVLLLRCYFE